MRRERRATNIQKMKGTVRNVEVEIDELILRGFPVGDRYVISDAFTHELRQLFKDIDAHSSFAKEAHLPTLNADRIAIAPDEKPVSVGAQVARAVYSSLSSNGVDR